jgi:hypothetical protein
MHPSPLLMNVYKREVKGKELPKAVADRIATASNRNLRKALLMLESCYVRHGGQLDEELEPVMAGGTLVSNPRIPSLCNICSFH